MYSLVLRAVFTYDAQRFMYSLHKGLKGLHIILHVVLVATTRDHITLLCIKSAVSESLDSSFR